MISHPWLNFSLVCVNFFLESINLCWTCTKHSPSFAGVWWCGSGTWTWRRRVPAPPCARRRGWWASGRRCASRTCTPAPSRPDARCAAPRSGTNCNGETVQTAKKGTFSHEKNSCVFFSCPNCFWGWSTCIVPVSMMLLVLSWPYGNCKIEIKTFLQRWDWLVNKQALLLIWFYATDPLIVLCVECNRWQWNWIWLDDPMYHQKSEPSPVSLTDLQTNKTKVANSSTQQGQNISPFCTTRDEKPNIFNELTEMVESCRFAISCCRSVVTTLERRTQTLPQPAGPA